MHHPATLVLTENRTGTLTAFRFETMEHVRRALPMADSGIKITQSSQRNPLGVTLRAIEIDRHELP